MKKLLSVTLLFVLGMYMAQAQTSTIAAARTANAGLGATATGTMVTLTGVVTNGPELGNIRYIQDATGGMGVFGTATMVTSLVPGDTITVSGTIKNFNYLMELDNVTAVTVHASGKPLPTPVPFSVANFGTAYAEMYEGQLVRLNGATSITNTSGGGFTTFAGNTNYRVDGNATYVARVNSASTGTNGIVGKTPPSSGYDIIGIMSQFSSASATTGYQLLPRLIADFVIPVPFVLTLPYATNITTSGFTVNFTTQNTGDTKVEYGLTTALGSMVTDGALVTNHSIAIPGLQPATIYYVKATSTNTFGSSSSPIVPMITASNSTGTMLPYFNNPVNISVAASGNNAVYANQGLDDTLIAYINRAKFSIDIAIYNWNNSGLSDISAAVNNAHNNGKQVRVVYDGSTTNAGISALLSAIPKIASPTSASYGIMHNKFVVIDANSSNHNDAVVIAGSTNWTMDQINSDHNSLIAIQDKSLALAYQMEFEEMWGSNTATPNLTASKFGPFKSNNTPHEFNIGGKNVELYFSPTDNVTSRLVDVVNTANDDFEVATMLCTRSDIANAIKNKYQAITANNCSAVILNDTSGASGPYFTMYNVMSNRVKIYNQNSFIMHHKYFMVDASNAASDPTAWVSTHNWSNSAEQRNDENSLVIHDYLVTNKYYQSFAQVFNSSNPSATVACSFVTSVVSNLLANNTLTVFPNPSNGDIYVKVDNVQGENLQVKVYDMQGREIHAGQNVRYSGVYQENIQINEQGVYLVCVQQGQQYHTQKVMISK